MIVIRHAYFYSGNLKRIKIYEAGKISELSGGVKLCGGVQTNHTCAETYRKEAVCESTQRNDAKYRAVVKRSSVLLMK